MRRYNVDCSASTGLYAAAEGAFGGFGEATGAGSGEKTYIYVQRKDVRLI